jgi:hypothetical protein
MLVLLGHERLSIRAVRLTTVCYLFGFLLCDVGGPYWLGRPLGPRGAPILRCALLLMVMVMVL